jgi:hypothetical protein
VFLVFAQKLGETEMKQVLVGMLTVSCALSAPNCNTFGNLQNVQLGIGQPAEAAPRVKIRIPRWTGKVIKVVGEEVLKEGVSATINSLSNNRASKKPASKKPSSSTIGYVGNLCKSQTGTLYVVTVNGDWIYYNGSSWTDISEPPRTVACYIDLGTDSSGELYWRNSQRVFGYVPQVGWVFL